MIKEPGKYLKLKEYKKTLSLSSLQREVLLGIILGDATVRLQGKIKIEQSIKRIKYVNHLYDVFKEWVQTPPKIRYIKGGGAIDRSSVHFTSLNHSDFLEYRNLFYSETFDINGIKKFRKSIRDIEFLEKWLTPRSLAYWFMDDGSFCRNKKDNIITNFSLSTHGFLEEENHILSKLLNKKFNFSTRVHCDRSFFKIYIPKDDVESFRNLIKEYIHSDFNYKIN